MKLLQIFSVFLIFLLSSCIFKDKLSSCNQNKTPKLFLDYWGGMSSDEYDCVTLELVKSRKLLKVNERYIFIIETQNEYESDSFTLYREFFNNKLLSVKLITKIEPQNNLLKNLKEKYGKNYDKDSLTKTDSPFENLYLSYHWTKNNKVVNYIETHSGLSSLKTPKDDFFGNYNPKSFKELYIEFLDLKILNEQFEKEKNDSLILEKKTKSKMKEL